MTTSGTVGLTKINTAKTLEKAIRRCGLLPSAITPEIIDIAKEDLFLLLTSLASRGLNLWCIDRKLMALNIGKANYVLPIGTTDVLNMLQGTPARLAGTYVAGVGTYTADLATAATVVRVAVKFSVLPTAGFTFESSPDNVTWTVCETITDTATVGEWFWFDVDPAVSAQYFRVNGVGLTATDLLLASSVRELPISQFNRDDYAGQPNKTSQSGQMTNFYFEKLVMPQITVWPVPNDDTNHIVLYRYRQIQDIGTLTQEMELPSRWIEAVTWHLALRLSFEIPEVTPDRREALKAMAGSMTIEVEGSETDSAPTYFAPNIGVYTQ